MKVFELKYRITDDDLKRINKSVMWKYFLMYLAVSLVGLAVGVVATVLRPRTEILVFGIILIVLGAILLVFSLLLAIAPRNFISSALMPSDVIERSVRFDDGGITISTATQNNITVGYDEIVRIKDKKSYLLLFIDKDIALIVKDKLTSGQTLAELYAYLCAKKGIKNTVAVANKAEQIETADAQDKADSSDADAPDETANVETQNENADGDSSAAADEEQ